MAPLTHHPFVSKSQAPGGWNLLQQVAPLTHRAPVTHHRTVVGTCHWWVGGRRPNSLEYQICTAPEPFDTLVTGLVAPGLTLPRLLPGGVGASGGGDAYDAERAAHQAAVHGQELKPRGQKFGVGIRRSSHDAESEATAVLSPFISLYPLNTCVHACYWHGVVCWSQSLMYYSIN